MKNVIAYLTFSGNCREAMTFYRDILGGELYFQTIGESPMAANMPTNMKNYILHSTLKEGRVLIMASDMVGENGLLKGNSVSLMLDCTGEADIRRCYAQLSEGGTATHPIEHTFWGALFGDLTDRFGVHWLLHYQPENNN